LVFCKITMASSVPPSRAALMTGRYSIRSGLSLVAVAGSPISLPATEITIAEVLRDVGYATARFGKWHLGAEPHSQPQNKGFDEFYGIPPADTWDAFLMISQGRQTKTLDIPLDMGPQIVEAKRGEPLKAVKPYAAEVRREIDWELVDRGVDFMKRQKAAGKPFFLARCGPGSWRIRSLLGRAISTSVATMRRSASQTDRSSTPRRAVRGGPTGLTQWGRGRYRPVV
jgi:arylsulfatase A-like enzyme